MTTSTQAQPINDEALNALFHAHTAYHFDNTEVTDAQLNEIYELTKMAPTAMNARPLRVTYIKSPEAKARLLAHIPDSNKPKSESAPVVAILSVDTDFHKHFATLQPHNPGIKERFEDSGRREHFANFNGWIQTGYFILAVRAVGLDAGPMGGIDIDGITKEFLGENHRGLLIVNIGHVSETGNHPRSGRLSTDQAVTIL